MPRLREEDTLRRHESGHGPNFLEALARSIRVIEAMGSGREALSLSDLARLTQLPKPSVGRILHTLCALGYAESVGRTFRLTPKVVRLATSFLGAGGNSRVLQEACDKLSAETLQSSFVAVLDGHEILTVAYAMPKQLLAPFRGVGARLPAVYTAAGRLLLSALPEQELESFLFAEEVTSLVTSEADLLRIRAEIANARQAGFSSSDDEYIIGWRTIAYPLHRHDGQLFGALSLNCRKSAEFGPAEFDLAARACALAAQQLAGLIT